MEDGWQVRRFEQRRGLRWTCYDAKNNILFASCRDNKNMIILSATDGHIITDLPIGNGSEWRHLQPGGDGGFQFARRWYAYGVKRIRPRAFC